MNTEIFNNINTEIKAYLLAWFWFRSSGRIQIHIRDIDILHIIVDKLKYTNKLYSTGNIINFNPNNKLFTKSLIDAGCVKNKSVIQTFPIIPSFLMKHFIRGIFDSYGTIILHKQKYLNVSIITNESFIQDLRGFLLNNLSIMTHHYHRYNLICDTLQMIITSRSDSLKFLDYVYGESNFYLTRKYKLYQRYLKIVYNTM